MKSFYLGKSVMLVVANDDTAVSAIAKFKVSPMKYAAPKVHTPSRGDVAISWESAPGSRLTYLVGVYDTTTKTFVSTPMTVLNGEFGYGHAFIKQLGPGKFGIQELLWEDGKVVAKSAVKVVTMRW